MRVFCLCACDICICSHLPSPHPPLPLLSPSSHLPLTFLSPSSHLPLTFLSPPSHTHTHPTVSNKTGENVSEAFHTLVDQVYQRAEGSGYVHFFFVDVCGCLWMFVFLCLCVW